MRSLTTAMAVLLVLPSAPAAAFDPTSLRGSHADSMFEPGSAAPRGRLGLVSVADDRMSDAAGADIVESAGEMAQGTLPVMTLDKTSLNFGVLSSPALQTGSQVVRLRQAGAGTVTWTAASSQPWLQISRTSGTGGGTLTATLLAAALPASGTVTGTIVLTYNGASTANTVINVTVRQPAPGTTIAPIGSFDTPLVNTTGVTGAIPVTGWALDDIDIAAVSVCRGPIDAEGVTPGACGGAAQVFIGNGVFIEGARPDLPGYFPDFPRNTQGGWGLMVLTNMLPGQGNGSYTLTVWARDVEGHSVELGTRTITCDNAHATQPFGTIDTPSQGEAIQGEPYVNFGWALTPQPKHILEHNLLSAHVYIDGLLLGPADYGFYRKDIADLFPGYTNTDTAVGFRLIYTSTLEEGLHTIVWLVTDESGAAQGIGSRFFTVIAPPSGAQRAAAVRATSAASTLAVDASAVGSATLDGSPIKGRRGWVVDAPWRSYSVVAGGERVVVQAEELDRIELQLSTAGGGKVAGFMRVGKTLQPLPVGSRLDTSTGVFTWSPGVGFVGSYDLVFLRGTAGQQVTRQEVRVILRAKGSGPQVVIDTPSALQSVGQPFVLAGWAADLDAAEGTGIDTLHVWAYPTTGEAPRFLGVASPGYARSDVADAYGDQFASSGYGLVVQGLDPGSYDIAVFAWSSARAGFMPARLVRVTVR